MDSKHALIKKALTLEYLLIAYNIAEAIVSVWAGLTAGSIALVGFGLDSIIEVVAAGTLVWRLKQHNCNDEEGESRLEKRAMRIVGVTFFLLAGYILFESVKSIVMIEAPQESFIGIVVAVLSLIIMPYLGLAKKKIAIQIGSKALEADAMETLICSYLSAILLTGLVLNALLGWWWADSIAGLVMVIFIVSEGWETFEESRD